jgi:beta-N-acetylhexosaminidase
MNPNPRGQLLMTGVPSYELDVETAATLRKIQPGAFILFGRNIKSPGQLRKLIDDLRDFSEVEPIITIDQEGGRVSRLKLIGNEPPNAQQLRDKGDLALIRTHGEITGMLLRIFGFNLDLCPVLDISFDDDADNSLRGRCYGRTVAEVIEKASAFNDGLRSTGVMSCGKHFPGYAAAGLDPHHDLPVISRSREELDAEELAIFRHFAPHVDSMMICHAAYPALDPEQAPASLSRRIVVDLLQQEHGFEGLIMTDDLDMGAIVNQMSLGESVSAAIRAGNHLAMICHRVAQLEEADAALKGMASRELDSALQKVAEVKKSLVAPLPYSEELFREWDAKVWDLRVAVLGPEKAAERSPEDGKRSPVEIY